MKIKFLMGFEKDLSRSNDKKLAATIRNCIHLFEDAQKLENIPNIKKIKGHPSAYRYRKEKYRIGFFVENNTIIFAAFAPRNKIYQKFP